MISVTFAKGFTKLSWVFFFVFCFVVDFGDFAGNSVLSLWWIGWFTDQVLPLGFVGDINIVCITFYQWLVNLGTNRSFKLINFFVLKRILSGLYSIVT